MGRVFLSMCLFLFFVSYGENKNPYGNMKQDDMFNCYFTLLCPLNNVVEYQKFVEDTGTELSTQVWEWIETVTGVRGPENTVENWSRYREVVCDQSDEVKKEGFLKFFQLGGEYWLKVCVNVLAPKCRKAEETATKMAEMFSEHMALGHCQRTDEPDNNPGKRLLGRR